MSRTKKPDSYYEVRRCRTGVEEVVQHFYDGISDFSELRIYQDTLGL